MIKGTCVFGRKDTEFNKNKAGVRPKVYSALIDKQALSRILTIQKRARDTLMLKAQLNSIPFDTKGAAFCYKAGVGRVAILYNINKAKALLLNED